MSKDHIEALRRALRPGLRRPAASEPSEKPVPSDLRPPAGPEPSEKPVPADLRSPTVPDPAHKPPLSPGQAPPKTQNEPSAKPLRKQSVPATPASPPRAPTLEVLLEQVSDRISALTPVLPSPEPGSEAPSPPIPGRATSRMPPHPSQTHKATLPSRPSERNPSAPPFPARWHEHQRAVPTICLRSALFAVVRRGQRQFLQNERILAQAGYVVRYTGMRLDQSDLDVWQQVIHLCRKHPLEERVFFGSKAFLRAIGRSGGKSDREWLRQSLDRMVACAVILEHDNRRYADNLLGWGVDENSGRLFVRINRQIAQFFEHDQFTLIDARCRFALKSQLAKWLHDYFSSQPQSDVVTVTEVRYWCGSETQALSSFRQKLHLALDELVHIGFLSHWAVDTADYLHIHRLSAATGLEAYSGE